MQFKTCKYLNFAYRHALSIPLYCFYIMPLFFLYKILSFETAHAEFPSQNPN